MAINLRTSQTIILVAAAISLTCACGIPLGPQSHYPPPSIKRSLAVGYGALYLQAQVGTTSGATRISLKNISPQSVELAKPALYPIHDADAFKLDTTCEPTLVPNATCFITITFSPQKKSNSEARLLFSAKPSESYGLIVEGTALKP